MSQQPCCKWSVQQLVLYSKTLSNRTISSGALSSHAHDHTYSTWHQQAAVSFPRGCALVCTTSWKKRPRLESFNRCFAKTKTMRLEESAVFGQVRCGQASSSDTVQSCCPNCSEQCLSCCPVHGSRSSDTVQRGYLHHR